MKYYIGVDLGTSAVKLLLMDQEGQVVNIVSREYPLSFPHPGWSEQKPEDWWEQSKEGIKELISKIDATEAAASDVYKRQYRICRIYRTEDSVGERK